MHTTLTDDWGLRYPIISAPMAGAAGGLLAGQVSAAGGLGMIGIGSESSVAFLESEAAIARAHGPFGLGLMIWALNDRPDLLEAALTAHPFLLSLSFGDPTPYVDRCHALGIKVATQVHDRAEARVADEAGVDLIVAQGTEAGGHTGFIATLPLLQIVKDTVTTPVVAAGGIATAQGIAAVLAAGAEGAWMGTAFLTCSESRHIPLARQRIHDAHETDTILTHVFDTIQALSWPDRYPGRALTNHWTNQWHGHEPDMLSNPEAKTQFAEARGHYDTDYIYAGQAVGLVTQERSAAALVKALGEGTEAWLRQQLERLL